MDREARKRRSHSGGAPAARRTARRARVGGVRVMAGGCGDRAAEGRSVRARGINVRVGGVRQQRAPGLEGERGSSPGGFIGLRRVRGPATFPVRSLRLGSARPSIGAGAHVIDATGRTLLPGLVDTNTHTSHYRAGPTLR